MKRGGSKTIKIMLKYAVYCLGFGMLQLSNCCLEDLKTWSNCNIGWEGIPLDNGNRMAIPGDPMCGLHVVRKGHGHQAIYNFVEEAEMGHRSSLSKGLPVLLRLQ